MRKLIAFSAIALAALLSACSHGGSTLPGAQDNVNPAGALRQKMLREEQRLPGTFVAPKHPGYLAEGPSTQNWPAGIEEAGQAPVPGGIFAIVNQYNTTANGRYVTVYAGSLKTTGAGVLLVVSRSADLHTVSAHTYTVAPDAVRIEGVSEGQLQLETVGVQPQRIPFRMPL
jgi:hypothetical protein